MTEAGTASLRAIAEQAAEWYLRMEEEGDASLAERQQFVAWLKASPAHIEEFMRVRAMHAQLAGIDADSLPDADELLRTDESNVVALSSESVGGELQAAKRIRTPMVWAAAASIAAVLFVIGFATLRLVSPPADLDDRYMTALGEQRSILLSDGSVVELNTQSQLNVHYTDAIRLVELVAGEAVFDVAQDPARPFRVDAGTAIVEAVGTRFNVYRQDAQTVVTVVEGRVAISQPELAVNASGAQGPGATAELPVIELAPGNQATVSAVGAISAPATVDTRKATAWTERRLVFDGDTLATVARELNRYNRQQLTISDPALAQRTISGVFNANDPHTLFTFLEAVGGMRVKTDPADGGWTLYPAQHTPARDSATEQR